MKTNTQKEKAKALYIDNYSILKISKEIGVAKTTVQKWIKKYDWKEAREKAINAAVQKAPEKHTKIIESQIDIVTKAQTELLKKLDMQPKIRKQLDEVKQRWEELKKEKKPTKEEFANYLDCLRSIYSQLMNDYTLVKIMTHGLEVVRPKSLAQYNFMKQENNMNVGFSNKDIAKLLDAIEEMEQ